MSQYVTYLNISPYEKMALGTNWVNNCLEDWNEEKDEDWIQSRELIWLNDDPSQPSIHSSCLQGPTGAL